MGAPTEEDCKLAKLMEQGGPFTSTEEVDAYLADLDETNMKEKEKRMKLEISYARDTSTLLPKIDPLLKIRLVDVKGKQRHKTVVHSTCSGVWRGVGDHDPSQERIYSSVFC